MTVHQVVRGLLDQALADAQSRAPADGVAVLDAGCGRASLLEPFRPRIGRFVGADIHSPAPGALAHLDAFVTADLCADADAFPPGSFDLILSSFTVEHFSDPPAAFGNMRRWLRPGGRLVITTVNRRHPFVGAYLALPAGPRGWLQRFVKAAAADAHPLVGACNDVASVQGALEAAGFSRVDVWTVSHLARAWGRRSITRALGRLGDSLAARAPSRRSTIVAAADVAR